MTWENRWKQGHTPWDAGASPPVLAELLAAGALPGGRALVPGCGAGYDVLSLAGPERYAVGIEIAPSAAPRFEQEREKAGVAAEHVELIIADFFSFDAEQPFDLVWDYTFLCALDPDLRSRWAQRSHALLAPGGTLATLLFPVDPTRPREQGPPFALEPEEVAEHLRPFFSRRELRPVKRSHAGREGKEWIALWQRRA